MNDEHQRVSTYQCVLSVKDSNISPPADGMLLLMNTFNEQLMVSTWRS